MEFTLRVRPKTFRVAFPEQRLKNSSPAQTGPRFHLTYHVLDNHCIVYDVYSIRCHTHGSVLLWQLHLLQL